MKASFFVITDSGVLQEEAPTFGKPVLVVRNTTERKEAIDAGIAKLIGTDANKIFKEASLLLTNPSVYQSMVKNINPFGDSKASERILKICCEFLKI